MSHGNKLQRIKLKRQTVKISVTLIYDSFKQWEYTMTGSSYDNKNQYL